MTAVSHLVLVKDSDLYQVYQGATARQDQPKAVNMGPPPPAPDEKFCLRWNDFQESLLSTLQDLRAQEDFVDVTLVCGEGGQQIGAHKLILSACSDFFRHLLRRNPAPNPVIVLWDMGADDVRRILRFMYNGEVEVRQARLNNFLAVAERLRVRGLCQSGGKASPNREQQTAGAPTSGTSNNGGDGRRSPQAASGSRPGSPSGASASAATPSTSRQRRRSSDGGGGGDSDRGKRARLEESEGDEEVTVKEESLHHQRDRGGGGGSAADGDFPDFPPGFRGGDGGGGFDDQSGGLQALMGERRMLRECVSRQHFHVFLIFLHRYGPATRRNVGSDGSQR